MLSEWCKQWAVEINVDKCEVMHMRRRGVRTPGERIEVVEEYKYLGCVINEQLGSRRMVEERAKAGARTLSEPNLPAIISISVGSKGFDSNLPAIDTIRLTARVMTQTCQPQLASGLAARVMTQTCQP